MAVVYEDQLFLVKSTWFGTWRVIDKTSGLKIVPEAIFHERLGFAWQHLRSNHRKSCPPDGWCERVLFQSFALAVTDPHGEAARLFRESSPEELAFAMVREANIRYLIAEDRRERPY